MIQIKRPGIPDFMKIPQNQWDIETEAIKQYYTVTDPITNVITVKTEVETFKFNHYNDDLLKEKLREVFKDKCAYCECSYAAVYDGDIEHFRPKGSVREKKPKKPGYYWLANNWDNLLLSCQHCNQRRSHELQERPAKVSLGKADLFPLKNESFRVYRHDMSIDDEEPYRLLINPCIENPEEYFKYEPTEGVIKVADKDKEMAEASIRIYALQRRQLVWQRKKKLRQILLQIERVDREMKRKNENNTAEQNRIYESELQLLQEYAKPESEFAGMARFFVKQYLNEKGINPKVST